MLYINTSGYHRTVFILVASVAAIPTLALYGLLQGGAELKHLAHARTRPLAPTCTHHCFWISSGMFCLVWGDLCMIQQQTIRPISHASLLDKTHNREILPSLILYPQLLKLSVKMEPYIIKQINSLYTVIAFVFRLIRQKAISLSPLASVVFIRGSRLKKWRIFSRFWRTWTTWTRHWVSTTWLVPL